MAYFLSKGEQVAALFFFQKEGEHIAIGTCASKSADHKPVK
jgi:hypothetical protein